MEQHYVCTGTCHGISHEPKTCENESCTRYGEELYRCECTDGNHDDAYKQDSKDLKL